MNTKKLAKALGWFSLGLGAAQMIIPGKLGRAIGIGKRSSLMRALGMRELTAGLGVLTGRRAPWLWSRVGGDAMDLTLLSTALAASKSRRARVIAALGAVGAVTALDVLAAKRIS